LSGFQLTLRTKVLSSPLSLNQRQWRGRERSFGLSVGGVLILLAFVFAWRGRRLGAEVAGVIGFALVVLGAARPTWLTPVNAVWWTLASALGWLNARILLSLAFLLLLTPLRAIWRISGYDPLERRRQVFRGWSEYPKRYHDATHFERMF
jgi:saxitoxin biosynthesis operon SxtJ-like protein